MPVATRSFTCHYDGAEVEITAGITRVADGHEIARRYPDAFSPDPMGRSNASEVRVTGWPPNLGNGSQRARYAEVLRERAPAVKSDPERRRTAKHEAAHAAAAVLLGWEVTSVELTRNGGGGCLLRAPRGLTKERQTAEKAVIAAAAEKHVGFVAGPGYERDREMIFEARARARHSLAGAAYERDLERYVARLVDSPRFRRISGRVTEALLESGGTLAGFELRRALRA